MICHRVGFKSVEFFFYLLFTICDSSRCLLRFNFFLFDSARVKVDLRDEHVIRFWWWKMTMEPCLFFFSFHFRSWGWRRVNVSFENAMKLLRRVAILKPSSFVVDSIAVYTPFWLFEELDRFGFQAQTFFHLHSLELVAPPLINQLSTFCW